MRLRPLLFAFALLALPSLARAEEQVIWDFRGRVPVRTVGQGAIQAKQEPGGLHVTAPGDGILLWEKPLTKPAEVVTVRYRSSAAIEAAWMWRQGTSDILAQLFETMPGSGNAALERDFIVSRYPEWDWRAQTMGMAFPAGTDMVIEQIVFRHWTPLQRFGEGWKTFWTFDAFTPYSINFLWGPLLALNAPARETLFDTIPPRVQSATRILYVLLLLGAGAAAVIAWRGRGRPDGMKRGLAFFAAVFAALWIVFDLRMGLELLSYAKNDWRTWVLPAEEERTLRTHGALYRRIEDALPALKKAGRFRVIAPQESPYFAIARYRAFPAVPRREGEEETDVRLWAVFQRPDIAVDDAGHLFRHAGTLRYGADGALIGTTRELLSGSGRIIQRLDDESFLFLENP